MAAKPFLATWISLAFLIRGSAQAANFAFGFAGCPPGTSSVAASRSISVRKARPADD